MALSSAEVEPEEVFVQLRRLTHASEVVYILSTAHWYQDKQRVASASTKTDASYLRRSLDRDNSGRITVNELQEALASLGVPVDAAIAGRMVDLIDVDGSSDISFQEFRRFAVLLPQSQVTLKASIMPAAEGNEMCLGQLCHSRKCTDAALGYSQTCTRRPVCP